MDRRMYRGNMGNNCGCNKNASPYRPNEPVCGDVLGGNDRDHDRCDRHDHCDHHDHLDYGCDRDKCDEFFEGFDRDRFPIGMCYVPWQCFRNLYDNEFTALANGTIFKELDLDWYGRGCK